MKKVLSIFILLIVTIMNSSCSSVSPMNKTNQATSSNNILDDNTSSLNSEVKDFAFKALKNYLEADFTDPNYNGTNGAAGFAVGFRTSEIISKANERLKLIKERQITRTISDLKLKRVEINGESAVVDLDCVLSTIVKGTKSEELKEFKVYLQNMGGGTWYTRNINPTIFP